MLAREVKALRDLGASLLPGMMIPTHKRIVTGKLYQIITVASYEKTQLKEHHFFVVYRDEKYNVYTCTLPDFKSLMEPIEQANAA